VSFFFSSFVLAFSGAVSTTAHAELPMGLKCAPKTKIVGAERAWGIWFERERPRRRTRERTFGYVTERAEEESRAQAKGPTLYRTSSMAS
jgi:hypothetical protein